MLKAQGCKCIEKSVQNRDRSEKKEQIALWSVSKKERAFNIYKYLCIQYTIPTTAEGFKITWLP